MARTVAVEELLRLREGTGEVAVLDVLPPEHYASCHIAGALNACVYEVEFLDSVARLLPSKQTQVAVYDTSRRSQAAACAAQKLERAGYTRVALLAGGLESWIAAGGAVEPAGGRSPAEPRLKNGRYLLDAERSVVAWTGRNIGGKHTGEVAVSRGELVIEGGSLASGVVEIDMTRITNSDLKESEYYKVLIAHLISEDFFETARYPTAVAFLERWRHLPDATPGKANYVIDAQLTIKGITHPVQFPAVIAPQSDGLKAQAALDIDRTAWNIRYGSGRFFEMLGIHLVHDMVTLEFFLTAVEEKR